MGNDTLWYGSLPWHKTWWFAEFWAYHCFPRATQHNYNINLQFVLLPQVGNISWVIHGFLPLLSWVCNLFLKLPLFNNNTHSPHFFFPENSFLVKIQKMINGERYFKKWIGCKDQSLWISLYRKIICQKKNLLSSKASLFLPLLFSNVIF